MPARNKRPGEYTYIKGIRCPYCRHAKLAKSGYQPGIGKVKIPRYICRNCGGVTGYPIEVKSKGAKQNENS